MAHIGRYLPQLTLYSLQYLMIGYSFVPADRAVIGLIDKILTRVHTRESVSKVWLATSN